MSDIARCNRKNIDPGVHEMGLSLDNLHKPRSVVLWQNLFKSENVSSVVFDTSRPCPALTPLYCMNLSVQWKKKEHVPSQ